MKIALNFHDDFGCHRLEILIILLCNFKIFVINIELENGICIFWINRIKGEFFVNLKC